ncbi:methyltransferase type 11 [Blastocladiella britannica]|nr:methyltransferase type 11 [Blastocladiella britannica]
MENTGITAPAAIVDVVRDYYGRVLASSKDLKTSACTTSKAPHPLIRAALAKVPRSVTDKYYGCGSPVPLGIDGLHVLDLGSGSGQDCYVAAALVGPKGSVTGIDMTAEQLAVARDGIPEFARTLGYTPKLNFVQGYIELLSDAGVRDSTYDLVISNCVVNLSPDKRSVLTGVYAALKPGGEFYFSDVYVDRRLPDAVRTHPVLFGECLGGALYTEDFRRVCADVGFVDVRVVASAPIDVRDPELVELVGSAKFVSITYRLFKLKSLEDKCEDYGQVAVYKGTLPGHAHAYALDAGHNFEAHKPMLVCGNTAAMVQETWLSPHFTVTGDRSRHFGLFPDCGGAPASSSSSGGADASSGGNCC